MTTMEDVLAAHYAATWTLGGTVKCQCGERIGEWRKVDEDYARKAHIAHVAQALTSAGFGRLPDDAALNRVEVIDNSGRALVKYTPSGTVTTDRQDDGRTLKIFITEGAIK